MTFIPSHKTQETILLHFWGHWRMMCWSTSYLPDWQCSQKPIWIKYVRHWTGWPCSICGRLCLGNMKQKISDSQVGEVTHLNVMNSSSCISSRTRCTAWTFLWCTGYWFHRIVVSPKTSRNLSHWHHQPDPPRTLQERLFSLSNDLTPMTTRFRARS